MITKERLEELIEQGAIIFGKYREYILRNREEKGSDYWWKRQVEIVNNELHYIYEDSDYYENDDLYIDLKDLYENKEDAEFVAKYHTQRVERFEPPTYEEFIKAEEFIFYQKYNNKKTFISIIGTKYLVVECLFERYYTAELTKENYIKAVECARKLFLGLKGEEDA